MQQSPSFQSVQTVYFTKNPFPYLLYIETLHVIMDILVLWFPILIKTFIGFCFQQLQSYMIEIILEEIPTMMQHLFLKM